MLMASVAQRTTQLTRLALWIGPELPASLVSASAKACSGQASFRRHADAPSRMVRQVLYVSGAGVLVARRQSAAPPMMPARAISAMTTITQM